MSQLDPSQERVARLPIGERALVFAGPGSGKTTTAAARLESFEATLDEPGEHEVLFISFSRASIKAALGSLGSFIDECELYVDARTLDALALQVCNEYSANFGGDEAPPGFEERLRLAIRHLKDPDFDFLSDVSHVIVDESQDVVGIRQVFLLSLIDRLDPGCGLTIFVDPSQSIYKFQVESQATRKGWEEFQSELRLRGVESEYTLEGHYRAQKRLVKNLYSELGEFRQAATEIERLQVVDRGQGSLQPRSFEQAILAIEKHHSDGALLFRTNAQVVQAFQLLVAADALKTHQPMVRLKNEWQAELGAWLAVVAKGLGRLTFQNTQLAEFLEANGFQDVASELSNFVDFSYSKNLSLVELVRYARAIPNERLIDNETSFVISTIHQSKGLEYGVVGVHEIDKLLVGDCPEPELAFVALTRARDKVFKINHEFPFTGNDRGRTVRYKQRRNPFGRPIIDGLLITPRDVVASFESGEAYEALLRVEPGSMASFQCINPGSERPVYRVLVDGQPVARTTTDFGAVVRNTFRGEVPRELSPVPLDGVETAVDTLHGAWRLQLKPRTLGFTTTVAKRD